MCLAQENHCLARTMPGLNIGGLNTGPYAEGTLGTSCRPQRSAGNRSGGLTREEQAREQTREKAKK